MRKKYKNYTHEWLEYSQDLYDQVFPNQILTSNLSKIWNAVLSILLDNQYILIQLKLQFYTGDIYSFVLIFS